MPEMCQLCGMNTAFEQGISVWRCPNTAVVTFACANCQREFSRIKHVSTLPGRMTMLQEFDHDDPYNVDNSWSPYTRRTPSVIRVPAARSKKNYIACNRRRKTAGLKDIVSTSHTVRAEEEFTIEEVNLEIRRNP